MSTKTVDFELRGCRRPIAWQQKLTHSDSVSTTFSLGRVFRPEVRFMLLNHRINPTSRKLDLCVPPDSQNARNLVALGTVGKDV